ncbi:MAG: choice-of-anchor D domain-containing protein [Candidatus Cloacimonetes bacterium]|nr:choice-of-anchor D domain-containing protein [Candidatus Cloacimonadota bacterium]
MKKLALSFLFLLLISFACAEVYTIGSGTNSQHAVPVNGLQDYGWSKMIYTAAELNAAGLPAGLIAGIGFHVSNIPTNIPIYNQQVYIRNTNVNVYLADNTSLPDNSAFQNVYYARCVFSGNSWNSIMFNSPFCWDGISNIEILWENWDGFGTNSYPDFYYSYTSGAMAVYQDDIYFFPSDEPGILYQSRPNIRFITSEVTIPAPAVLVAPANAGYTMLNTSLRWNTGSGMPSSYDVYFGTNPNPPFVVNQSVNNYQLSILSPGTTYYWKIVPQNNLGQAVDCPVWSFSTPSSNQLVQSFETSVPPPGWICPGENNWYRSTFQHTDGTASAFVNGIADSQSTLSTPKLNITAGSTLTFDLFSEYPAAAMEIVYSADRINWNNLYEVPNYDGNTWETKILDLSGITGSYYLGFRSPLNSLNFYLDAVIGPQLISQLPGVPIPTYPNYQATDVSIFPVFTWDNPSSGGIPTGYNVYLDTNSNPTTLIGSFSGNIFIMNTPLEYNSTYFWKMTAVNEAGEGIATPVFNFTTMGDITVNTFPFYVDFGTVPEDWPLANWTQLKGVFPLPTSTGSQWSRDDWVNVPANNNAARMNVFGTQRYGWLISPPINIPSEGFELQFSLGLTDYTNPSPIEDPTSQLDDKFIVAISDTRNMANPVILREWNNAGSPYVYNEIPHTGLVSSIPLSGINGTKYFAFYGESTQVGGDNDLYVDNITIRLVPSEGNLVFSPSVCDFGEVLINHSAVKSLLVTNNGYATLNITSAVVDGQFFNLSEPFSPFSLAVGESDSITVNYLPTAAGDHNGSITFSSDNGSFVLNLSANCHDPVVSAFPWSEDFGTVTDDWPVADWTQFSGPFPTIVHPYNAWVQDDWLNQPSSINKATRIHVNTSNHTAWLITPGFNLSSDEYQLSFDLGLTLYNSTEPILAPHVSGYERFIVSMGTSPTMADLVVLGEWNNIGSELRFNDIPHTGTNVSLPLNDIGGLRYFAFYLECNGGGGNFDDLMIDNVTISSSSGNSEYDIPAVAITTLKSIYPNPFNPQTTISYSVKEPCPIAIEIFNLKGQMVKSLVHESKSAGEHTVLWDSKDESGKMVGSGIYFCRLSYNGTSVSRKMILAK